MSSMILGPTGFFFVGAEVLKKRNVCVCVFFGGYGSWGVT